MKRILLAGNGFDIQFNKNFAQNKLVSKFIHKKKPGINFNNLFKFAKKNKIEYFLNNWEDLKGILEKSFSFALSNSNNKDSIETIFYYIKDSIIEQFFDKCIMNIQTKFNNDFCVYKNAIWNYYFEIYKYLVNKRYQYRNYKATNINFANPTSEQLNNNEKFYKFFEQNYEDYLAIIILCIEDCIELIFQLKYIYLDYIDSLSINIKSKNKYNYFLRNIAKLKLSTYSYILTTNWTNIIDWIYGEESAFDKISHIHGAFDYKYKRNENPEERYKNVQLYDEYLKKDAFLNNFDSWLNANIFDNDKLTIDIFGFSLDNKDDSVITNMLKMIKRIEDKKNNRNKIKIDISYFYYNKQDEEDFINFKEYECNYARWPFLRLVKHYNYREFYGNILEHNKNRKRSIILGKRKV